MNGNKQEDGGTRIDMSRKNVEHFDAKGDSLASSPWMRAVSRYLTGSIRVGAYVANLYFLSLIDFYVECIIASSVLRHIVYLTYGIVLYEIAALIVKARYRPKFVRESEIKEHITDRLVLNKTDYAYRVMAEKLIYQSSLYYGFSLVIAVAFFVFIPVEGSWRPIALGLMGGFLSVMNFLGIVIFASSGTSFSPKTLPMYLMACGFTAPLLIYIIYTFRWAFSG